MKNLLLDCTLRDGGYVNDWNFGHNTAIYILERLVSAKIDFIEIGLLDERVEFNINRTINPNTKSFDIMFSNIDKQDSKIFAMIDYGTCGIENIEDAKDSFIDGIRIIFKKNNMYKAVELAKQIKEKGYLVSLQLVSTTSYTDRDILDFCDEANKLKPFSIAIVDTYGLMHKEDLFHYFEILNHNISNEIVIGYHSHNNFQLAYANSIELLKINKNRNITIDGSIYGMGKSAGNAPSELLAMHLNEFYNTNYNIDQILEALDSSIMRIYNKYYWGYSFKFYLSALNDCHPSYIDFLLAKKTLSVKSINEIVIKIEDDKKLNYNEKYIEELYLNYQTSIINDDNTKEKLKNIFLNKDIVLLAPGKSVVTYHKEIQEYIQKNSSLVISINNIIDGFDSDYIFISNSKRYSSLFSKINSMNNLIVTSNITSTNDNFRYILDYSKLLLDEDIIVDNSMLIFINFLKDIGINKISLAGFDGFSIEEENYFDDSFEYNSSKEYIININQAIKNQMEIFSKSININYITPSQYKQDKND